MKITRLETIRLLEFPNILWVRVHGEDGLYGLGETFMAAAAVEAFLHEIVDGRGFVVLRGLPRPAPSARSTRSTRIPVSFSSTVLPPSFFATSSVVFARGSKDAILNDHSCQMGSMPARAPGPEASPRNAVTMGRIRRQSPARRWMVVMVISVPGCPRRGRPSACCR